MWCSSLLCGFEILNFSSDTYFILVVGSFFGSDLLLGRVILGFLSVYIYFFIFFNFLDFSYLCLVVCRGGERSVITQWWFVEVANRSVIARL